jgi:predicted dehydrogenase
MKTVKWGIIGCGDVTEIKSGPAFNLVNNSELVAVMRRNADKAKDYATRHHVPKWYSNADDLINDADVNAIYVATPPNTHAEYAIKSMQAGKPVYVEKPMALNYAEAKQMVAVSEKTGVPLFVAYYRRSLPNFLKVKELISQGAIGQVRCVNIQLFKSPSEQELMGELGWRVKPEISGSGHFFDLASHQLDYIDFLFGPIKDLKSHATNQSGLYKAEDFLTAFFTLGKNIICTGTWCFSCSPESNRDTIEIIGDEGIISLSCFEFKPILLLNKEGIKHFDIPKPKHVQYNLIDDVVQDLLGHKKSPSNGETAARTSWVMDKVVENYYMNKNKI